MKQLILLALGALAIPVLSYAQAGHSVQFGLKTGASLSTLVGAGPYPTVLPLTTGVGGVFATVPLGTAQRWFLQPELLYSPQGYRLHYPELGNENKFRSDYLTLPLLLGFTHGGLFAAVGPQVGYLVHARNLYRFRNQSSSGTTPVFDEYADNYPHPYQRWQLAAVAAIGYRWPCGAGIELRYTNALSRQQYDFLNPRSDSPFPDWRYAYSLSAQVQASYLLPWH